MIRFAQRPDGRVAVGDRLHLALLESLAKQRRRILTPLHFGIRVDAELLERDRKEVLGGARHIAHANGASLETRQIHDSGSVRCQQAHAAAVDAGSQLHIEALFKRLDPAQRHADPCVRFAGRDGFEQLVR